MEGLAVMGFFFRNDGNRGACSFEEINKDAKRKRNSRRELQGNVNDCCKALCNR